MTAGLTGSPKWLARTRTLGDAVAAAVHGRGGYRQRLAALLEDHELAVGDVPALERAVHQIGTDLLVVLLPERAAQRDHLAHRRRVLPGQQPGVDAAEALTDQADGPPVLSCSSSKRPRMPSTMRAVGPMLRPSRQAWAR